MKKAFIHITAASMLSWASVLFSSVIILAVVSESGSKTVRNLIASVIYSLFFSLCLLYVRHVRNGRGEDLFFADYEKEKYVSMKKDVTIIYSREKDFFKAFILIVAVCFAVNSVYIYLLNNTRVFFLSMVYATSLGWTSLFPSSSGILMYFVGYLLSYFIGSAAYLLTLLIYRYRINIRVKKGKY